jgi:cyanophycinase-like exopeptidase
VVSRTSMLQAIRKRVRGLNAISGRNASAIILSRA